MAFKKDFVWGVATSAYQIEVSAQKRIMKDSACWYKEWIEKH